MKLDRHRPPDLGHAFVTRFPAIERAASHGGLETRVARLPTSPFVSLSWVAPAGGELDPTGSNGLAHLTAAALDEGTSTSTSEEIAARIERLGGAIGAAADWDAGYLRLELLAEDLEAGLDLLAEVLVDPVFPETELERLRHQRLNDLRALRERPGSLADVALARALYADGSYGRLLGGDRESIARLDRTAVQAAHRASWLARGSALVAAGNVNPGRIQAWAAEFDARLDLSPTPHRRDSYGTGATGAGIIQVVDRPGAAQTELRIGHPGIERTHADRSTIQVLNAVLGGKFTSRINLNLRERHGYTYGAFSRFAARRGPGPFVISAAVGNEVAGAAAREALGEVRRIRDQAVDGQELDDARDYIVGVFPYTLQTAADVGARLEDLAQFDLPNDEIDRHLERVAATTLEDLQTAAQRHLDPEALRIVAVGPAAVLVSQLEELGEVEVIEVEL